MRERSRSGRQKISQRDLDTIEIVEELLSQRKVDVRALRKISAVRGLVTAQLRKRVWPLLLDVDLTENVTFEQYHTLGRQSNDFRSIISVDVHRSLFHYYDESEEFEKRQQHYKLERLLNAVICYHEGEVHYYQGLHDIASVLLLTLGEASAFKVLCKLSNNRLRDCTRSTLEPVAELLNLQVPILKRLDPVLGKHVERMDIPCYFAISWFITWFSHDVPHFHEACRLFDFFLASHPMMPLYIGAAGMQAAKTDLLKLSEMSEMHNALVNLKVNCYSTTDEVILKAISLYHHHPPRKIVREMGMQLQYCVSPFATLTENQWIVPLQPPENQCPKPLRWLKTRVLGGAANSSRLNHLALKIASMAGIGFCAAAVLAMKLMDNQFDQIQKKIWEGIFDR
eukprot:g4920.t1